MNHKESEQPFLVEKSNTKYQVGQVWNYKTRSSEPNSTFTVVKVEDSSAGVIVHIYIEGVKVRTDLVRETYTSVVAHSPFSEAALDSSVTKLKTVVTRLPEYEEGYKRWRDSFLEGDAGVFSIPVDQSVQYIEQTMLQGHPTDES